MQYVAVVMRIIIAGIFLLSAIAKVRPSSQLHHAVQQFTLGLVGTRLARLVARGLPILELILGISVLTGIWLKLAAAFAGVTLLLFTASIAINLARGNRFRCNCFGAASSEIGVGSLSRNAILVVISLTLAVSSAWNLSVLVPLRADMQSLADPNTAALFLAGISACVAILALGEASSLFRDEAIR